MSNYIITINREYGSGGRTIGKMVAEKLGMKFFDKEIISLTAKKSGFTEDFVRETNERKTASLLYSLYMTSLPASDQLFLAQTQVINDIANEGNAVIIGSCSNYILRNRPDCLKVFVHAPIEERIKRARDEYKEATEDIRSYVTKRDKRRVSYYNYFTQYKWGSASDYDLCINSSIGIDACADIIVKALEKI